MTFATRLKDPRRFVALMSALAVLMSLMTIYAEPARAHHPTTTADQVCVDGKVKISYTSTSWNLGEPGHLDVRVEVSVDGGAWTEVAKGKYESANNYSFSGTFDAEPYWGDSIRVRSQVVGNWPNGAATGNDHPETTTSAFTVSQDCFNPSCPSGYEELKLEGANLKSGSHGPDGAFTVTINGLTFDWTSNLPVYQVIAKGGPGANVYNYSGEFSDEGLHAPTNPKNGKYYGLSHITFCYQDNPQTQPVTVTVTGGECATGSAEIKIDPDTKAKVKIYSDSGHTNLLHKVTSSQVVDGLSAGTYYWKAKPDSGYHIEGQSTGSFTIEDCDVSVVVTGGDCVVGRQGPTGSATVTIDPDSKATVKIYSDAGYSNLVTTVTSTDDVDGLAPGTYYWKAEAKPGYDLNGNDSGQFTIEDCDVAVTVIAGPCEVGQQGEPAGSVDVTIDPGSGATVTIYTNSDMTGEVASLTESGSVSLAPGTYYWEADAAAGFDLDGPATGQFTIEDCEVSIQVTGACNADDLGTLEILIDVPGAVTVDIPGVGQFTESETVVVTDDDTYSWTATAQPGFTISGDASGEVTVPLCAEVGAAIFVSVDGSCQIMNGQGQGVIDVSIAVDDGATVTISDSDGVIDTFTSDATLNVDAGASYTWEATPNLGFEFPPGFEASGTIDIEDCTPPPPPPDQGVIIVQKVVQGDGDRDFEFTFVTQGFTLGDNTLAHGQNSSSGPLTPGSGYSVSEVLPSGWEQLTATCDDGSLPSNIELSAGEQVTCTFVNTVPTLVAAAIEVTVDGRCELDGDVGTGFVDVVISVDNGATVVVRNSAGTVVGTLTEDGTVTVAEGATYTWQATPAEGFEFPAGAASSGTITIERCSDLDELPFTGLDLDTMVAFAAALLGAGLLVLGTQPRRREQ